MFLFCCHLGCLHCGPLGWMDGTETGRAAYAMNLRICNRVHARHVKIDAIGDLHNVADPLLVWCNMRTLMHSFTKCHVQSLAIPAFDISYVQTCNEIPSCLRLPAKDRSGLTAGILRPPVSRNDPNIRKNGRGDVPHMLARWVAGGRIWEQNKIGERY